MKIKSVLFSVVFFVCIINSFGSETHYVNTNSVNPVSPYTNWATASTNIQMAIDSVNYFATNDIIIIDDGTYSPFIVDSDLDSKLEVIKSVNGASSVIVDAQGLSRCATVNFTQVTLNGLTFRNGSMIVGDSRGGDGGCVYLYYGGHLNNCIIEGGYADGYAGGVMVYQHEAVIVNCTIVNNSSRWGYSGIWSIGQIPSVYNTIIYFNTPNDIAINNGYFWSCAISQIPSVGFNCITLDPLFISNSDYRLQSNSPCIDSGTNALYSFFDMDNIPRPLDGNSDGVCGSDIGASEYVNYSTDSDNDGMIDGWEVSNNLNAVLDDSYIDSDGDRHSNINEYIAGTNPQDINDVLKFNSISSMSDIIYLAFNSKLNRTYGIVYTTDMVKTNWASLTNGVIGSDLEIVIEDVKATNRFYMLFVTHN